MMTVSIVIPTYNRAHLISRSIRSVMNQTHESWELIVVDDGSTDNTEGVIQEYLRDPRVQYHKKANSGAADSRNFGVEKASSQLITFLDSDDEAEPHWIEVMIAGVRERGAAVVCCGLRRYDSNAQLISTELPSNMGKLFPNVVGRFTNGGVYMMQRSVFLAIGGFDKLLRSGQHTELAYRLVPFMQDNDLLVVNVMEPLIKVHIHQGARIRFDNDAIFLGSARTLEKHAALFKKDKQRYINYLSVAGVSGVRTKRYAEAQGYFLRVLMQRPLSPLSWIRYLVCHLPGVRDWMWKVDKGL